MGNSIFSAFEEFQLSRAQCKWSSRFGNVHAEPGFPVLLNWCVSIDEAEEREGLRPRHLDSEQRHRIAITGSRRNLPIQIEIFQGNCAIVIDDKAVLVLSKCLGRRLFHDIGILL